MDDKLLALRKIIIGDGRSRTAGPSAGVSATPFEARLYGLNFIRAVASSDRKPFCQLRHNTRRQLDSRQLPLIAFKVH